MISVGEIAKILGGECIGDAQLTISGASKIDDGKPGTITFLSNDKYTNFVKSTKASAVIVDNKFDTNGMGDLTFIKVENVYLSLAKILELYQPKIKSSGKVSSFAIIEKTCEIHSSCDIGHYSTLGDYSKIGEGSIIENQVCIGNNVIIGKNCRIYPGVKIYNNCQIGDEVIIHANTVLGSDGFGFSKKADGSYYKVHQIGKVVIEDFVEIGANTVIDKGSIGDTVIKKGVKLDNLIQIAHNVSIDENTAIAAQTGIAGSSKIGRDCTIGGQVGIGGHLSVADGAMIQGKTGISSNVLEKNAKLYGYPALPYNHYLRSYAHFKNLTKIVDKIKELEIEIKKTS
jgi:UDP-3-O-[3-hydroxymyristoyl] glucosamine N-acyltransferase